MSLSISQIGSLSSATSSSTTSASSGSSLSMDDFFKLLAAELQYQDPTNPTSNDQFMEEMAQYSTLSAIQGLEKLTNYSMASGLIGKTASYETAVTANGNTTEETVVGEVEAVDFSGDTPQCYLVATVDGKNYGDWVAYSQLSRVYASDVNNDAYSSGTDGSSSGSDTSGSGTSDTSGTSGT